MSALFRTALFRYFAFVVILIRYCLSLCNFLVILRCSLFVKIFWMDRFFYSIQSSMCICDFLVTPSYGQPAIHRSFFVVKLSKASRFHPHCQRDIFNQCNEIRDCNTTYYFCVCIRNWIILNEKGQFVCQRKAPGLALVVPHFEDNKYLCLDAPGMKTLKIDLHQNEKESKEIR